MKKTILALSLSASIYAQSYKESINQQFFEDAQKGYVYSLYHYKNENLNIQNEEGQTPLMVAVQYKHVNVIRAFADGNINIKLRDYAGKTAYDYVEGGKQSTLYGALKYLEVIQIIKKRDKVVSYSFQKGVFDFVLGKTSCEDYLFPQDTQCHESKKEKFRYVDIGYFLNLEKEDPKLFGKVFPNYREEMTQVTLEEEAKRSFFNAIRKKDRHLYEHMIDHVDLKIKNRAKYSILWAGIFYKNYDVVSSILERGADIYAYDSMDLRTPLLWAVQENDAVLLKVLIAQGVELDSRDKFGNPIIFKAMYRCKSFDSIAMMLDNGANPYLKNRYGETVFDIKPVFCKNKEDIVKMKTLLKERSAFSQ